MRVLLDECVPHPLKQHLTAFQVSTAQEMGWASIKNGQLLRLAEQHFDVFVTLDRHIHEQQDLKALKVAVVILLTPNRIQDILPHLDELEEVLSNAKPGEASFVRG